MFKKAIGIGVTALMFSAASAQIKIQPKETGDKNKTNKINVQGPNNGSTKTNQKAKADVLSFLNGDKISGKIKGIDSAKGLKWGSEEMSGDIHFRLKNLKEVNLGHIPKSGNTSNNLSSIYLTNGDRLVGTIVELGKDTLKLDTWYAGRLNIEKLMIKAIAPASVKSVELYQGPNSLKEWSISNNKQMWKYKNGAITCTGSYSSIGKNINLPDKSRLDMNVSWRSRLNLTLYFYTDRVTNTGGNSYRLQISGSYFYLYRQSLNRGGQSLGQANDNSLYNKKKCKLSICTDKEKKTITLLIDGKVIKVWNDPANFQGNGKGLVIYPNTSYLKFSDIKVSEWDGKIAGGKVKATKKDTIKFVNNDVVTGELLGITNNEISFKTPFATLKVPVARAKTISLGEENQEKPRRNTGDVKAYFASGGFVTLKMGDIKEGKLNGSTENFGKATFNIKAFNKILLNIYDDRHNSEEEDDDDW